MAGEDLEIILWLVVLPTIVTLLSFWITCLSKGKRNKIGVFITVIFLVITLASYGLTYYVFQLGKMGL